MQMYHKVEEYHKNIPPEERNYYWLGYDSKNEKFILLHEVGNHSGINIKWFYDKGINFVNRRYNDCNKKELEELLNKIKDIGHEKSYEILKDTASWWF